MKNAAKSYFNELFIRAIALQKVKEGVKYSNRSIRGSYYAQ